MHRDVTNEEWNCMEESYAQCTFLIGLTSSAVSSLSNMCSAKQLAVQTKVRVYQTLVVRPSQQWGHTRWVTRWVSILLYSDMSQSYQITLLHTRPCYVRSSCQSVDLMTQRGNVSPVIRVPSGPLSFVVTTTTFALPPSGGKPSVKVLQNVRCGSRRLHVNDDDTALLTPNSLGETCLLDIRSFSTLELLRNHALQIDIYLLT